MKDTPNTPSIDATRRRRRWQLARVVWLRPLPGRCLRGAVCVWLPE